MRDAELLFLAIALAVLTAKGSASSVLENYEEKLNTAMASKGMAKTVKRYKCVEEYVTYDHLGRTIDLNQGVKFTTTAPPVTKGAQPKKEIRRKPTRKITIPIIQGEMLKASTTTTQKPLDEMNDEEADRLIEEMYLKKKESHNQVEDTAKTTTITPATSTRQSDKDQRRSYSTGVYQYRAHPIRRQKISSGENDYEPLYSRHRVFHRRHHLMPQYEDYEDLPFYRPYHREFRLRRRRPIVYSNGSPVLSIDTPQRTPIQHLPESPPMRAPMPLAPKIALPTAPSVTRDVLKMKPLTQAEPAEFQEATEESCTKITKLAANFGIKNVSQWARGNCDFLKMYAPSASCELIFHFIDSCKMKRLF